MMKNLKRLASCGLFLVLLFLAIGRCADILEYKEARKKYKPFYESETNFDVIFMGTSHMWNHVLPMELWDEYGIASYNWAYSNCTPAENYYLLQDVLKFTSPKLVVLDMYGLIEYEPYHTDVHNGKYQPDRIEQQHIQFDSIPLSVSKVMAAKDVFDDYSDNNDFIWNFIMYHNRWSELNESDFEYDISTEKGSYFLTGLGTAAYDRIEDVGTIEINSVCYPYFLEILEYCEEHDISVLCTYLPFAAAEEQQRVANTIGPIIESYSGCSYVNMLNEGIVDFSTDMYTDNMHLNFSGAKKVTSWLGQYLVSNYMLDEYFMNESWQQDYQDYYGYKLENMQKQTALTSFLSLLYDTDFEAKAEIYDSNLLQSERLIALLEHDNIEVCEMAPDEDVCIKLIIKSNVDGNIYEFEFTYEDMEEEQINRIVRR
jgi:hypothetical protein